MKKDKWILGLLFILLPLLSGCTTSDDVHRIFTGKTWKLTYISKGKGGAWYRFPNTSDSDYTAYGPSTGTRRFTITFNGAESDHVVSGSFSTAGTVSTNGTWSANGESKAFSAKISGGATLEKGDKLAAIIKDAISNADKYSGDEMNLFLHFTYEKDRIFLAFAPVKE